MGEFKLRRILSLDGGGIRGIITGKVLEALEEKLNEAYAKKHGAPRAKPVRLGEYFDMIPRMPPPSSERMRLSLDSPMYKFVLINI